MDYLCRKQIWSMDYDFNITGCIGWDVSKDIIREQLTKCKGKHCNVNISSKGGDVDDALDIYEQFRSHGDVTVYLTGMVASAATIIAMGAKHIVMSQASIMLIHKCSSPVCQWDMMNEDDLGNYIKELKTQQQNNQTIDGVIANIYSLRNHKECKDNIKKMSNSVWMTAAQAKDFGLADEILDDGKTINFTNSELNFIKNMGLPMPPAMDNISSIVDSDGNPTPNFLQKTAQKVKALIHNKSAQISNQMIKTFNHVGKLLGIEDFTEDSSNNIVLTQDQVKKVDDRIRELETKTSDDANNIAELTKKVSDLQTDLTAANNSVVQKDEQIKNLKSAPGAETTHGEQATVEPLTVKDVFNCLGGL